jgi:hypothetical protein
MAFTPWRPAKGRDTPATGPDCSPAHASTGGGVTDGSEQDGLFSETEHERGDHRREDYDERDREDEQETHDDDEEDDLRTTVHVLEHTTHQSGSRYKTTW